MEKRSYLVWKLNQRKRDGGIEFAIFVSDAKDILNWAGIKRVGEHPEGTQRILKETRVKAIQRFLNADERNTIPTSVIVAFLPGSTTFQPLENEFLIGLDSLDNYEGFGDSNSWGVLSFEFDAESKEHDRLALIVDGQHRLQGMAKMDEDIPVLVVALLDASPDEQAFQFVVINNKAAKVNTDNVKAIISDINENDLQERLAKAGVNYGDMPATLRDIDGQEDSPFYHLLDWPLNPDRGEDKKNVLVKLTTIEVCLRYIRNAIPATVESGDEDTLKEVFLAIWQSISTNYSMLWASNSQFMSKVNINALNEFVVDSLENAYYIARNVDIYNPKSVKEYVQKVVEPIPPQLWENKWKITIQDTGVIRELIKEDLMKIIRNQSRSRTGYNEEGWDEKLKLI